jgi:hypothetical protein
MKDLEAGGLGTLGRGAQQRGLAGAHPALEDGEPSAPRGRGIEGAVQPVERPGSLD